MTQPLSGLRVLVTRARKQASDLTDRLEALGAVPLVLPSIEIQPTDNPQALDSALRSLNGYEWVVLTSVNGVEAVIDRLDALNIDRADLASRKLAVIGPATAAALAANLREPDLVPDAFVAEAILEKLQEVQGVRFLLARADLARKDLADGLRARGAQVDEIVAYRIVKSQEGESDVFNGPAPDVLTFTSSSGVRNTYARLQDAGKTAWFEDIPIVCIGPITASTVRELGAEPAAVAGEYTIPGLVDALLEFAAHRGMTHA